jgi:hypothetical protein
MPKERFSPTPRWSDLGRHRKPLFSVLVVSEKGDSSPHPKKKSWHHITTKRLELVKAERLGKDRLSLFPSLHIFDRKLSLQQMQTHQVFASGQDLYKGKDGDERKNIVRITTYGP